MKNIALLNTSVSSFNRGDDIIMESVREQLKDILRGNFVLEIPTHSPAFRMREVIEIFGKKNDFTENLKSMDYKFVCGTNLLSRTMFARKNAWNLTLAESKYLSGCVFLGVGAGKIGKFDIYTKKLLKNALSNEYIHSVRDEEAKKMLESIGLKAINTGCPTLWNLDQKHCERITTKKSNNVIFTLTDYKKDIENDQKLINILNKNYEKVYFWIQGFEDYKYLTNFDNIDKIELIGPSVKEYDEFLKNNECDFVGTRLHAGIKAMQRFKRSIIIIVDNRARSMKRDYNLNCIEREDIEKELEEYINKDFKTNVKLKKDNIEKWKSQF